MNVDVIFTMVRIRSPGFGLDSTEAGNTEKLVQKLQKDDRSIIVLRKVSVHGENGSGSWDFTKTVKDQVDSRPVEYLSNFKV